jgi:8-oxo-dGTP pyrophosphatase MutT (NUDIX family)
MENSSVKTVECSGALICSKSTKRFLLLQKAEGKHTGYWGLVGGTHVDGESAWQGLSREIKEEIGEQPITKTIPLEKFVSNDQHFKFQTYFCLVADEFIPQLSSEHCAWGWFDLKHLPKPLHKGLDLSLRNRHLENKISTIIDIIDVL